MSMYDILRGTEQDPSMVFFTDYIDDGGYIFFFLMIRPPPRSTPFPYTPLFRSRATPQGALGRREHGVTAWQNEPVGPVRARDRSLGVGPHRDARDAEERRLLLEPPRIGDDERGAGDEAEHLQVTQGLEQLEAAPRGAP